MAGENTNLLSTPEGYATPEQIKAARAYAAALLHGNMQQPVKHWSQGVSNMVSALVGGNLDYNAAQREQGGRNAAAEQQQTLVPGANYPKAPMGTNPEMPKPSFSESPSSAGGKRAEGGAPDDVMSRASKASASIESGGRYDLKGPVTKTGDQALGKYQVMGANLPEWSAKYLGKTLTPEQFLADPQAQEDLYKAKFGEYIQKYGPEGAAKAWFAGEKGMHNPNATDRIVRDGKVIHPGMTVRGYGQKFMKAFGPDAASVQAAPAVQAMSAALRGGPSDADAPGTEVAASGGRMPQIPGGGSVRPEASGGPVIDPRLIKPAPGHTPEQLRAVLANPWVPQHIKDFAFQTMMQRGQAIELPSPTGMGTIRIDPSDPRVQQYFAPKPEIRDAKIGDIQSPVLIGADTKGMPTKINPARAQPTPVVPSVGPRSDAAPQAPVGAPQGGPALAATPGPAMAENAPVSPVTPPIAPESAEAPAQPVQVAATDPAAGISATVPKPAAPAAAPKEQPPLARMAQAGPPPGVDPEMWEAYRQKQDSDVKVEVDKDLLKKTGEQNIKKYEQLSDSAAAARKQLPMLDYGLALINDPNIYQGILANEVNSWQKVKAALPFVFGDDAKFAAAPAEVFNKVVSGSILDLMKSTLAGLGQVRVAEIDLLRQANAANTNTPAANRALLELSRRAMQKIDYLDDLGQQYFSGSEVVDPVSGKVLAKANMDANGEVAPRRGLDVGFDKIARKWQLDNPTLTPEEIKNYQEIFRTGIDPRRPDPAAPAAPGKQGAAPAQAPAGASPYPKEAVDMLRANPAMKAQFDEIFGPGASDKALGSPSAPVSK